MLDPGLIETLRESRNLLAFSGGADSTALFFLLEDAGVEFDLAHVNYGMRPRSDAESASALALAERHGKRCHTLDVQIESANFEHLARRRRYDFFAALAREHSYDTLLTAHQLNDRLEWLLMQLCKGAGLTEMNPMEHVETRENYRIVRPLLRCSRTQIETYLNGKNQPWFEDESNRDERHLRNRFRHRHAETLMHAFEPGIRNSFDYLDEDRALLTRPAKTHRFGSLILFETPPTRRDALIQIDRLLKREGWLMRRGDKERLKRESSLVVGRRFAVSLGETHVMIAPYRNATMDKTFKERCRTLRIDPKLRGYLASDPEAFETLALFLRPGGIDAHGEA